MKSIISVLIFLMLGVGNVGAAGILKTDGKKIVDENGDEIMLRGMGLGGWMLQEGYMMHTASFANAQFQIRAEIEKLIGSEKTRKFYDAWLANHCRKADIDSLVAWGFNAVRLPMHYKLYTLPVEEEPDPLQNTWLNQGFELTDSLLSWCASNEIYLILDLHAAPGGQGKDAAISDYDDSKPSLWESPLNRLKTVALWRRLAERYAGSPWIAGYDLINETNWDLPNNNLLRDLYKQITTAIREVDSAHIIFIEGNGFANDFTGLVPPWDDNMVYSFHKYWNHNDRKEIQWMLDLRNTYDIPVWCGESGENSNVWFSDAIRLLEQYKIGWSWWPLKKVESISCPLSIPLNEDYQTLLDYWEGRGAMPSVIFSFNALMQLAGDTRLENCRYQKDVIDALIRQVNNPETRPYKRYDLPAVIFATDFDLGRNGYAYLDKDVANYNGSTGSYTSWNKGWSYRNDGVDIQPCEDTGISNGFNVGWMEDGEWLKYTFNVERSDSFKLSFRVAGASDAGRFKIYMDGGSGPVRQVAGTGGWQEWKTLSGGTFFFPRGKHELRIEVIKGGFNLSYFEFTTAEGGALPVTDFELYQNYPNPFNPGTTIAYYLSKSGDVQLKIYDNRGRLVRDIRKKNQTAGKHFLELSASELASGVYYYQLLHEGQTKQKKMILIR